MNRTSILLVSALLAFSAPSVSAWSAAGDDEPNTVFDTAEYMPQGVPTAEDQVYFNAVPSSIGYTFAAGNPNTAAVSHRVSPTPTTYWFAFFGIWADCNGDGAIGMTDNAVVEYRAELLGDDATCPTGSSPHNDGEWVNEFRTIGMVDPCTYLTEDDPRRNDANDPCFGAGVFVPRPGVIYSNATNLWGDQGHPGELLTGSTCAIRPHPRGTLSNTGLMLQAVDCLDGFRLANTINENDPTGGDLTFSNPRDPAADTGSHPLAQNLPVSVFGNPNYDGREGLIEQNTQTQDGGRDVESTATTWDCSSDGTTVTERTEVIDSQELTQSETSVADAVAVGPLSTGPVFVPGVSLQGPAAGAAADPTDASAYQAGSAAFDGLTALNGAFEVVEAQNLMLDTISDALSPDEDQDFATFQRNDCDDATQNEVDVQYFGANLYGQDSDNTGIIEGANAPDNVVGKRTNAFAYTFFDGGFDPRDPDSQVVQGALGEATPPDGGVVATKLVYGPMWSGTGVYASVPQSINRATLQPSSRAYWTSYAQVDPVEMATIGPILPGGPFVYGSEACGSETDGVHGGWVCDPDLWFPEDGTNNQPRYQDGTRQGARVHDVYHMRDVDCYDGTVAKGTFVRASLTDVSPAGICDSSVDNPVL